MFCSTCLKIALTSFHKYECPLMEVLIGTNLTPTILMALRTFFFGLSLFDGSLEEFEKFVNGNAEESFTMFDCQDPNDSKQRLLAVHSLISSEKVEVNDAVYEDLFICAPTLKPMWASNSSFIKGFLRKQTQVGTMNYHEIYGWPLKRSGLVDPEVDQCKDVLAYKRGVMSMGSGSFPFVALINHSCSPNICRFNVGKKAVLIVLRGIEKGEQLFDNYGYNFMNMPKDYRQSELLKQYKFQCACKACESNWPLMPALKVVDKAAFNRAKKACRELSSSCFNQKKAFEKYRELCELITKGQKSFPCLEVCSLIDSATAYLELSIRPQIQF
jgi:SET domain